LFEIVFLGTAAGVPAVDRGLPALMVLHRERRFLVDCGEGTQRQLLGSGLGLRRLDCVLLTHGHLDHLLGLGGLAGTMALLDTGDRLTVYGGASALRIVRTLLTDVVWPEGKSQLEVRTIPIERAPSSKASISAWAPSRFDTGGPIRSASLSRKSRADICDSIG